MHSLHKTYSLSASREELMWSSSSAGVFYTPGIIADVSAFAVQDLALSTDEALPVFNRCAVHALAAAYLNLICQLTTVPAFCQHIHEVWAWALCVCVRVSECQEPLLINCLFPSALQVIEVRQKESPYLLPEGVFIDNPRYVPATLSSPFSQTI